MPDLRPVVPTERITILLTEHFHQPVTELIQLEGGQIARTYAFRVSEQAYVVRFNHDNMLTSNFPKEQYIVNKLLATSLPVAPVVKVGRLDDWHFAISRKMPGKLLMEHTPAEVQVLLPQILEMLETLYNVDVSETQGYGVFDYQGRGMAASWRKHLLNVGYEEDEKDYFGKWYNLFDETFLEREFFERLYQRMCELLEYCPEERHLVFGGLNTRNMLAQDGKITALLDWLDASYGDVVYELVGMDFWFPALGLSAAYQADQRQRQRELPFFAERLLCYECYHALGGLRFFAKAGNEEAYHMTRMIIQQKLDAYAG